MVSNRSIFFILITVISLTSFDLKAYPYAYQRLILRHNNKIVKIVDLISDIHLPAQLKDEHLAHHELEKNIIQRLKDIFTTSGMGPTEQALIKALEKIGSLKNGIRIEMIGESSSEYDLPEFTDQTPFALMYIGDNFHKHYDISANKRLIYTHGDCYRAILLQETEISTSESVEDDDFDVEEKIAELYQHFSTPVNKKYCKQLRSLIKNDVAELKQKLDRETYKKIKNIAHQFLKNEFPKIQTIIDSEFLRIMDYELLIKILGSEARHIIVYAGGLHCQNVSRILTHEFNFKIIKSAGTKKNAQLDGWKFRWKLAKTVLKTWWHTSKKINSKKRKNIFLAQVLIAVLQEIQNSIPPLPPKTWESLRCYPPHFI